MTLIRRARAVLLSSTLLPALWVALFVVSLAGGAAVQARAQAQAPAQPQQQDEFIPIDQLPPQDQLPAAPLLIGAYVFVVLALFGYVFSIARRLTAVQRDVERLEGDIKRGSRG
ncbi:MAG: hypothetical protein ABL993_00140 [Vicinamibacterales bacterium]